MNKRFLQNKKGFTIVELMIATSVFSIILLVITSGIVQIGKNYYKGLTTARTQEAARSIEDSVTNAIQVSGNTRVERSDNFYDMTTLESPRALCVGNTRYTFVIDSQLSAHATNQNTHFHALWMDTKLPNAACKPVDISKQIPEDFAPDTTINNADPTQKDLQREMLSTNMRVTYFNIEEIDNVLYKVDLKIIYGDDDVIDENGADSLNSNDDTCKSSREGGQFCAASELHTFVKRRL